MEGAHALLGPSSAERWISCPASVRMARQVPTPPSSIYADEGTACHALAEIEARHALIPQAGSAGDQAVAYQQDLADWREANLQYDETEMRPHAMAYVDLLRTTMAEEPGSVLFLEQKVPTGVPSCWGTADAVIVSTTRCVIVDLKYGKGVQVDAFENPQLMLYGVGALESIADALGSIETVQWCVFQPRLNHVDCVEMPAADLRAWRDTLITIAEAALGEDAPFGPSETACRWCPVSGNCKAQMDYFIAQDFGVEPGTLDAEDLAELLPQLDGIEAFCAAVRASALDRALNKGEVIKGYRVVRSNGKRYVTDEDGVIEALDMLGFDRGLYTTTKVVGIGALEKLGVIDTLSPFISKTDGGPALAVEGDRRPSYDKSAEAASDFDD